MFWNKWKLKRLQQEQDKRNSETEQPGIETENKRDSLNMQETIKPSEEAQAKQKRGEMKR